MFPPALGCFFCAVNCFVEEAHIAFLRLQTFWGTDPNFFINGCVQACGHKVEVLDGPIMSGGNCEEYSHGREGGRGSKRVRIVGPLLLVESLCNISGLVMGSPVGVWFAGKYPASA